MKTVISALVWLAPIMWLTGQSGNPNYDPALAERLDADDYGMKQYVFVMLKSGDNRTADRAFIDSCFTGHLANIGRLADEGKIIVAGPFGKNGDDFRGIFIVEVSSLDEAAALMDTDPAIHAGLLKADLYPWYGSAALPVYLESADRIWKIKP